MNRRHLLVLAATLAAVAVLLAVSGGVRATVGGFRISARSPVATTTAAVLAVAMWWVLARRAKAVDADLDAAWAALDGHAASIMGGIAVLSGGVAATFATNSAAGADASGYLSEAAQWATGQLFYRDALAPAIGAADPWLTTPLGWRPGPTLGLQSPTYPPGLPLLMAIPHALGGPVAASLVVTVSAALAVWATGRVAARLAGGVAGIVGAVALAVSPILMFQSVQPMSDVPVTAAWMLTWWLLGQGSGIGDQGSGRTCLAGILCGVAVLIRPNLAPLAALPLFLIGLQARRLVAFSIPVALAGLFLMWLQWQWSGSPLRSGYGTADELFALANVGANASRYASWLLATSPLLLLAPIGVALTWRLRATKALAAFAVVVVLAYFVYAVFDVWSYLRFLLPALAVAAAFTGVAIVTLLRRLPTALRLVACAAVMLATLGHGTSHARSLDTFRLAADQQRVQQVSDFLETDLAAADVVIAGEQSGAIRYYTGRSVLRWDAATPEAMAAALDTLATGGRAVVIAIDAWEHESFRARLGSVPALSLEWPPAFEAGTALRTRVWQLADRDRFLRGEPVPTIRQP